jgi:hypothetical protein
LKKLTRSQKNLRGSGRDKVIANSTDRSSCLTEHFKSPANQDTWKKQHQVAAVVVPETGESRRWSVSQTLLDDDHMGEDADSGANKRRRVSYAPLEGDVVDGMKASEETKEASKRRIETGRETSMRGPWSPMSSSEEEEEDERGEDDEEEFVGGDSGENQAQDVLRAEVGRSHSHTEGSGKSSVSLEPSRLSSAVMAAVVDLTEMRGGGDAGRCSNISSDTDLCDTDEEGVTVVHTKRRITAVSPLPPSAFPRRGEYANHCTVMRDAEEISDSWEDDDDDYGDATNNGHGHHHTFCTDHAGANSYNHHPTTHDNGFDMWDKEDEDDDEDEDAEEVEFLDRRPGRVEGYEGGDGDVDSIGEQGTAHTHIVMYANALLSH